MGEQADAETAPSGYAGSIRSEGIVVLLTDELAPKMGAWTLEGGTRIREGAGIEPRNLRRKNGVALSRWPSVMVGVVEDGAGIDSDDIRATLNAVPFPARFDPEDGFVAFDFFVEPEPGEIELRVELRDRVGNVASSSILVELRP